MNDGRAVLITGASSGIGLTTARVLAGAGFDVFAGVRDEIGPPFDVAIERITPIRLDVVDPASVGHALALVGQAVGRRGLAGLVNNAGVSLAAPLEYALMQDVRRQFEVNVLGQLAVTHAALPLLRLGTGRIVMLGSLSGRIALPYYGPYAASKFALEALTQSLRQELLPWRIAVSMVEPGAVATGIWAKAIAAAERTLDDAPPIARERYGPGLAGVRRNAARLERTAARPEAVAGAVLRALTDDRPRARYRVAYGLPTRALRVLAMLPEGVRDDLVRAGLPEHRA